jgi:hypothetical protein
MIGLAVRKSTELSGYPASLTFGHVTLFTFPLDHVAAVTEDFNAETLVAVSITDVIDLTVAIAVFVCVTKLAVAQSEASLSFSFRSRYSKSKGGEGCKGDCFNVHDV